MEENQARSIDPLKVFWSRKWELIILSMVCTVTSYFVTPFIPKVYVSDSAVLISPPKFNTKNTFNTQNTETDPLSIDTYKDLVYTSGYLQSVIEQLKLKYPKIANNLYPEHLKNMLSINTPIVPSSKSEIIPPSAQLLIFKVKGQNPEIITEIANIITTLLAEESRKMRANEIANISKSTRTQYLAIKKALIDQEHALGIFKRGTTHKLNTSISEEKTNNYNDLQSSLGMTLDIRKKTLLFSEVEILRVRLELAESASKVASLTAQTKNHPDLLTEDFLREQSKRDSLLAKEKFLAESIENYKRIILALERKYQREESAEREILVLKNSLVNLSKRLGEIQILESEKTSDIRFLSKAIKPHVPISPNKLNIVLISFVVSFTLGGGIALAKEHLDNVS
ncbi:MAG: hypothetical protein H8E61_03090 [Bacteroidetes bacterium]|nr:hypothetical protein [Bacteroidota bacterium]